MLLNDIQKKARKEFCQNYIDSDYSKMIFTDKCVFKGEKQGSRNGVMIKKAIKDHQWRRNDWQMYGMESD